jgi:hypothetical protein
MAIMLARVGVWYPSLSLFCAKSSKQRLYVVIDSAKSSFQILYGKVFYLLGLATVSDLARRWICPYFYYIGLDRGNTPRESHCEVRD